MFGDGSLTFREFMTREPHPLATIHDAVLEFLRGRDDAEPCTTRKSIPNVRRIVLADPEE